MRDSVAFGTLRLISTVHSTKLCVCINFTDLTLTALTVPMYNVHTNYRNALDAFASIT